MIRFFPINWYYKQSLIGLIGLTSLTMPSCSICNKTFKNVNLHIRKIHDVITLNLEGKTIVVYKNGIIIDRLNQSGDGGVYCSKKINKEDHILILSYWDKDANPSNPILYYGHKVAGFSGHGPGEESPTKVYCKKYIKIGWDTMDDLDLGVL